MKKSLLMLGAAAMMLASCTQNEVVEVAESRAIGFYGTGIDNITKADDITTSNFEQFYVYGGHDATDLFQGTEVNKQSGGDWQYSPTQYWKAGNWKFGAYAPESESAITPEWSYNTGLTLTVNSDKDHQNDVVYADGTANVTDNDGTLTGTGNVSLSFTHLLSKLAFKFTKDPQSLGAMTVTMSNFQIEGITTEGQWIAGAQQIIAEAETGNYTDVAGEIKATEGVQTAWFYVIPQDVKEFTITADVKVVNGASDIIKDGTISAKVPITGITAWAAQNQYLYSAQLNINQITDSENPNPQPIVFEGSAANWNSSINNGNTTIN